MFIATLVAKIWAAKAVAAREQFTQVKQIINLFSESGRSGRGPLTNTPAADLLCVSQVAWVLISGARFRERNII